MANNSRPTVSKRAREKARIERQKEKEARRAEARDRRGAMPPRSSDEDPDIAGIVPGPQPRPDWLDIEEEKGEESST